MLTPAQSVSVRIWVKWRSWPRPERRPEMSSNNAEFLAVSDRSESPFLLEGMAEILGFAITLIQRVLSSPRARAHGGRLFRLGRLSHRASFGKRIRRRLERNR